jgi:hypothetical protein
MLNKIKKHFVNGWGITGYSMIYIASIAFLLMMTGANKYSRWQCSNYTEATGFESKYIEWDSCFIKGSDGVFIRYDDKYKSVE